MPPDATKTPTRRRAPARRKGPPSSLLIFLPPLIITAGTVGVAAAHTALGSPLGPSFAAEVWSLAKTFVAVSLTYSGFSGFVVANNRRAWDALDEAADGDESLPPPRPITSRSNPARPTTGRLPALATDTMRRRRTGRLTPVESLAEPDSHSPVLTSAPPGAAAVRKDGAPQTPVAAEPAGASDRKARQAGGGSP